MSKPLYNRVGGIHAKRLFCLSSVAIFVAFSSPAHATDVTSNITTNTTWDVAGSPYIVKTSIFVINGVTLTINPGVEVKFEGNYSLTTQPLGIINAQGAIGNEVKFTSNKAIPAKGDWLGLSLSNSSIIDHVIVEYAATAINIISVSPPIQNSLIHYNNKGLSFSYASNSMITGNTITDNLTGIYLEGSTFGYPNPTINNNSIYNNQNYNIYATNDITGAIKSTVNVQNNWWGTTDPYVIMNKIYDIVDSTNGPTVDFTPFLDGINGNSIGGQYVHGGITQNTIWNSNQGPYIAISNITVTNGATLTIDPGTEVKFDGNFSLTVNGTLNAVGTAANMIKFTSNKISPSPGDWNRLQLNTNGSVIQHAIIDLPQISGRLVKMEKSVFRNQKD
jgi:parallel beta-helix repeat protein